MNRRGFLGLLGAAASAALIGELPSSKTFFLPPAGGWHPDQAKVDAAFRAWVTEIAESMRHTKEQVMADVINRGFGMARIKPEGGSIAYDHVPYDAGDLSEASIERLCVEISKDVQVPIALKGPMRFIVDPTLIGNSWSIRTRA